MAYMPLLLLCGSATHSGICTAEHSIVMALQELLCL